MCVATAVAAGRLQGNDDVISRDSVVYGGFAYGFSIRISSAKPQRVLLSGERLAYSAPSLEPALVNLTVIRADWRDP